MSWAEDEHNTFVTAPQLQALGGGSVEGAVHGTPQLADMMS